MHTRSAIKYFQQTFTTLFSKQFSNIALSSLIIHTMMMLILYFLSIYLLYRGAEIIITPLGGDIIRFFIQGYMILFVMIIAALISRGWQATVMPIRAIDHTKGMHFRGDVKLFHEHFGKYISFLFWYSMILFFVWNIYIFITIFLWAIHPNFGFLSLIGGIIFIIRISLKYSLSWYHMLSEGGGSLDTFLESKKYIKHRFLEVFLRILSFGILVWLMSFAIELFLLGFLSSPEASSGLSKILNSITQDSIPLIERMKTLILTLQTSYGQITFTGIGICLIYSLSSVITRAMFHIFFVHYYLQLRDEWEEEKSS